MVKTWAWAGMNYKLCKQLKIIYTFSAIAGISSKHYTLIISITVVYYK